MYNPRCTDESASESEILIRNVFIRSLQQSNNETILDQGTPIKTSLVANIRTAYYTINFFFSYHKLKIHNKVII